jgi:EAL domain-containing protein (putative c-di-GMP-specific phosphodiesterase class I)
LYYQRIAPVNGEDRGDHFELLIRMLGQDGKLIPPGASLPAAERYNLSTKLDRWVIAAAISWLSASPALLDRLNLCAINLSGQSLSDRDITSFVGGLLEGSGVPPEKLCFEVTETAAIANLSTATAFIEDMRKRGCLFALDGFGSGLSSFVYLKNLPVDFLKIDGVFVKDMVDDPIDFAMVRSINDIGHVMGKKTIAEFVENDKILARLKSIGVDYAQGYGIAKPMPIEDLDPTIAA